MYSSFNVGAGICLLLSVSLVACTDSGGMHLTEAPVPVLDVALTELMVLGGDQTDASASLLGNPRSVATDQQGNIYVADVGAMGIKVYDEEGSYVRTIGERGREEGQLHDITCMYVDSTGHIIVADNINKHIIEFSSTGQILALHEIDYDEMLWPRQLIEVEPEHFLFLYRMPDGEALFHVFDGEFQKEAEFGAFSTFDMERGAFSNPFSQIFPGYVWRENMNAILFAPGLYSGKVHRYRKQGDAWVKGQTLHGYVHEKQPFTDLEVAPYIGASRVMTMRGRKYAAKIHNESRGVFTLNDGHIVHFTVIESLNGKVFGVELYTAEGELLGYSPLEQFQTTPSEDDNDTIAVFVSWKDDADRFYVRDHRELPVVRVIELDFHL